MCDIKFHLKQMTKIKLVFYFYFLEILLCCHVVANNCFTMQLKNNLKYSQGIYGWLVDENMFIDHIFYPLVVLTSQ
jgi:hypothetical protein